MPRSTPGVVQAFERLLPVDPEVTRRLVFGHPAAFVRGQMFFGTFGDQLFVRLGPEELAEAMRVPGARPFEPMAGRAMSGYVVLPVEALGSPGSPRSWIRRSLEWTRHLPPKGKRRKGAAAPKRPPG